MCELREHEIPGFRVDISMQTFHDGFIVRDLPRRLRYVVLTIVAHLHSSEFKLPYSSRLVPKTPTQNVTLGEEALKSRHALDTVTHQKVTR